jgi:D-glycero-alpha-D-manno-heptose 1-phosphate guanylyltransferase
MPSVLIICGGFGTRLRGLYPELPKPLIQVHSKPFIEWIVLAFIARGFRDFVFAAGYLSEKIQAWSDSINYENCTFQVVKENQPLGTGGAILNALSICKDEIVVTNGDSLLLFDFMQLINYLGEHDMAMAARWASDCSRYGSLEVNNDFLLEKFTEKQSGAGLINGGVYFFKKSLLSQFTSSSPISMEMQIIPTLLNSNTKIVVHDVGVAPFIDIGTPEAIVGAEDFVSQNESFWKKVT